MKRAIIFFLIMGTVVIIYSQALGYEQAIRKLQTVEQENYPNASTVMITSEEVVLDEHCLSTTTKKVFSRILNEKGRKEFGLWFGYDKMYDTLSVKRIEVIKSDGTTINYDPGDVLFDSGDAFSKFSNIYSESTRMLKADIPNLEIGDIVYYETTKIEFNLVYNDNFYNNIYLEGFTPYIQEYYRFTIPADIKVNIHHINKKEGLVTCKEYSDNDYNIYEFESDNVPELIWEPYMENTNEFTYYIVLTTVESWEELSDWYYSLVEPHLKIDDNIRHKVQELTMDCDTREEIAKSIFYWVAQKVRYLGVDKEKNKPGFEPHDVTYTFSTLGGVCRDKAALLVAMLREAGIDCDPILISVGSKLNYDAPIVNFNHAVAVSYDDNGEAEFFYDPTSENTKDLFPGYLEDCTYLVASKKRSDLQVVPVTPADNNSVYVFLDIKIDNNNNAHGKVSIDFKGVPDGYMRSSIMQMNPQKRKELIERMITRMHPLAVLDDYSITDPEDKDQYMNYTYNFSIDNYLVESGNAEFLRLEAVRMEIFPFFTSFLNPFNITERKYPFKLSNTFMMKVMETVTLADDVTDISIPDITTFDSKGIEFNFLFKNFENKSLQIISSFAYNKLHFKQEDYQKLKNEIARLDSYGNSYIILENRR